MCLLRRGDHFTHGKTLDGTLSEALPILFEFFSFYKPTATSGELSVESWKSTKTTPTKKREKEKKKRYVPNRRKQPKQGEKYRTNKKRKSKIRFKSKKTTLELIAFLCAAFAPAFLVSWGFSSTCQYYFVVIIIHYCSTWVWSNKFQVRDSSTVKGNEKKGPWVFGESYTHFCFP